MAGGGGSGSRAAVPVFVGGSDGGGGLLSEQGGLVVLDGRRTHGVSNFESKIKIRFKKVFYSGTGTVFLNPDYCFIHHQMEAQKKGDVKSQDFNNIQWTLRAQCGRYRGKANLEAASQWVRLLSKIPECKSVKRFEMVVKDGHLFLSFSSQMQY